ncbi:hypothetical protein LT966_12920 [Streptomyces griseobrunneus]
MWFTGPKHLFPAVTRNLTPGGTFAFSQAAPSPAYTVPSRYTASGSEAESELTVLRQQYTPQAWTDLPKHHGFTDIGTRIQHAPDGEGLGTRL